MTKAGRLLRRTRLVIGVTVGALVLGACGSPTRDQPDLVRIAGNGGTVDVGLDQPLTSCVRSGGGAMSWADSQVLAAVAPSAFATSVNGFPTLNDAVFSQIEVVNTSPQTVVYTLNPKAVWQDGHSILATDLIANWHAGLAIAGPDQVGYRSIASITPDATGSTATVVFATPDADWRALFTALVPAHVAATASYRSCATLTAATYSSAAPFLLESTTPTSATLVRNPRWWGTTPALNRVVVRSYPNHGALVAAMERGDVQVIQTLGYSTPDLVRLTANPRVTTQVLSTASMAQMAFALNRGPTASPLVRSALTQALDRSTIALKATSYVSFEVVPLSTFLAPVLRVDAAGGNLGGGPVTTTTTTSSTTTTVAANGTTTTTSQPPGPTPNTSQLASAAGLLRQAGYVKAGAVWKKADRPLAVTIAWPTSAPQLGIAAQQVAANLRALGVVVVLVEAPSQAQIANGVHRGIYNLGLLTRLASPFPTESQWWYSTATNATVLGNPNRYNNASINASYLFIAAQLNPVTANPDLANIDATLWSELPAVPLYQSTSLGSWGRVTGVAQNPWTTGMLASASSWAILVRVPTGTKGTPVLQPNARPQ